MKYLFILLLLSSCYTQKRAKIQFAKVQSVYPKIVAENCDKLFPTKDSVSTVIKHIKGDTDTLFEFVKVDCDTVTEVKYKDRIVLKKVPKYIKNNDTIEKVVFKQVESTAKVKALQGKIEEIQNKYEESKSLANKFKKITLYFSLLIFGLVVFLGILIKKKI